MCWHLMKLFLFSSHFHFSMAGLNCQKGTFQYIHVNWVVVKAFMVIFVTELGEGTLCKITNAD